MAVGACSTTDVAAAECLGRAWSTLAEGSPGRAARPRPPGKRVGPAARTVRSPLRATGLSWPSVFGGVDATTVALPTGTCLSSPDGRLHLGGWSFGGLVALSGTPPV
jgi:hypothetical protein